MVKRHHTQSNDLRVARSIRADCSFVLSSAADLVRRTGSERTGMKRLITLYSDESSRQLDRSLFAVGLSAAGVAFAPVGVIASSARPAIASWGFSLSSNVRVGSTPGKRP